MVDLSKELAGCGVINARGVVEGSWGAGHYIYLAVTSSSSSSGVRSRSSGAQTGRLVLVPSFRPSQATPRSSRCRLEHCSIW